MASKYLNEFEELNTTTNSIYDLGDYEVLIILKDGTNLTSWDNVNNKKEIIYISEDLTGKANFLRKYKGLSNLKAIVAEGVGNKIKSMPNMSEMFAGCTSLVDVSAIFDWNGGHFESDAFDNCLNIEEFPKWHIKSNIRSARYSIRENPQRMKVFKAFKDEDTLTPSEIAKKEDISSSTVRTNLDLFLEKGLVYITNPERKRNRTYKLTEDGKKVMDLIK